MLYLFVTSATADAPIVTPCIDRVFVSVVGRVKQGLVDTAIAIAVRAVARVFNFEGFKSGHVFKVGFNIVGKRSDIAFRVFLSRVFGSMRVVFVSCIKS